VKWVAYPVYLKGVKMAKQDQKKRFWAKVNKDSPVPKHNERLGKCWEWVGAISADNYGIFYSNGKTQQRAHRFIVELRSGKKIPPGKLVCHKCDNSKCVRPGHLYIGTATDNNRDTIARARRGKSRVSNKLGLGLSTEEKFWLRVNKDGECWSWNGTINKPGYGCFATTTSLGRKVYMAHRWLYEHLYGPIPDSMVVMHTCDNTSCVRPEHLKLGTHNDNMADMTMKGRGVAKLTAKKVLSIYSAYKGGETGRSIAKRFKVTPSNVSAIVSGQIWKQLKLTPIPQRPVGAKMTMEKATKLRAMSHDKTNSELSQLFDIAQRTVRDILNYISWRP